MYETLELQLLLGSPAMVLKRELMKVPVWGWATTEYGAMVVDRNTSARALKQLMREGKALRESGRSVIVYAEGTRVPPGESPPLRSGFAITRRSTCRWCRSRSTAARCCRSGARSGPA
ncbi:lysophospholipid acyltransferase family protein [Sphingomonas sp. MMS24-JH45]